jgi:hypothetical protein
MAAYFFASPIDVDIKLSDEEQRKQVEMKSEKEKTVSCPVYYDGDSVSGTVRVQVQQQDLLGVDYLDSNAGRYRYGYGTGRSCSMMG